MNYLLKNINEKGTSWDGKPCYRFEYCRNLVSDTDEVLLKNFFKCATWIKEHYPNLSGTFSTSHDPFYKLDLIVEDGVATLAYGSHNVGYSLYLSEQGMATYSQGSMQSTPFLFEGLYGFRNDKLIKFLDEWQSIKSQIVGKAERLSNVFSDSFTA